jgi:hypothetical protein
VDGLPLSFVRALSLPLSSGLLLKLDVRLTRGWQVDVLAVPPSTLAQLLCCWFVRL